MATHRKTWLNAILLIPLIMMVSAYANTNSFSQSKAVVQSTIISPHKFLVSFVAPDIAFSGSEPDDRSLCVTRYLILSGGASVNLHEINQDIITDVNHDYAIDQTRKNSLSSSAVEVGEGWEVGNLRVVPVTFHPLIYDRDSDRLDIVRYYSVELDIQSEPDLSRMRRTLRRALGGLILNDMPLRDDGEEEPGGYVYVMPNDNQVCEVIRPLSEWRSKQGFAVREYTIPDGFTGDELYLTLRNIHEDQTPIEYVCLVGDVGGQYSVPTLLNGTSDYGFGLLSDNSPFPDAAVGRISYNTIRELERIVNKILSYEHGQVLGNMDWLDRASVCAGSEMSGLSTILVSKWVRNLMLDRNFTEVDTFWYTMGVDVEGFIENSFNRGVGFINYRGWTGLENWSTAEAGRMHNNYYPVALLLGCNTGDFNGEGAGYTEALLRAQGGCIGAIGSAGSQSRVNYNNALMAGFYRGVLEDRVVRLGWALNRAKIEMYSSYDVNGQHRVLGQALATNLMGDPGTIMWVGAPHEVELDVPEQVLIGLDGIEITVRSDNRPLPGARVGLYKPDEIIATGYTDENGSVVLTYDPIPVESGTAWITVSGDQVIPYSEEIEIIDANRLLVYQGHWIVDDDMEPHHGNGDFTPNPFETIEINTMFRNLGGGDIIDNTLFTLSTDNEFVQIDRDQFNYMQVINSGGMATVNFLVTLEPDFPHRIPIPFTVEAVSGNNQWINEFSLSGVAHHVELVNDPTEEPVQRGVERVFDLELTNTGGIDLEMIQTDLRSLGEWVEVIAGEGIYDPLAVGDTVYAGNVYDIVISPFAPYGEVLPMEVWYFDNNQYQGTIYLDFQVVPPPVTEPTGPDEYGYWAIDNNDAALNLSPAFRWIELNPAVGGTGINTGLLDRGEDEDKSTVLQLPFPFKYYGQDYDKLTVCTNGWAAFGVQPSHIDFRNLPIGTPQGPTAQLCPWWDDLYQPGIVGGIFYKYDTENHIFIVEWYRMRRWIGLNGPGAMETFEIILHDPVWYPTYTGDGDIIFQYQDAVNDPRVDAHGTPYATIGIGSQDDRSGLEYGFWNQWSPGAGNIARGTAIRFATAREHRYGIIHGTVVDLVDNMPVEGAVVRGSNGGWTTVDEMGEFFLINVLADMPTTLTVSASGYNNEISQEFQLEAGAQQELGFRLRHPEIAVDIEAVHDTLDAGGEMIHPFTISNGGNGELDFNITFSTPQEGVFNLQSRIGIDDVDDPDELWDNLFGWSVSDSVNDQRILGACYTDEGFIISGGNNGEMDNFLYHFDDTGRLISRIAQPCQSMWGIHDLAWDGASLYGGAGDLIYVMNLQGDVIHSLESPLNPPRGLAVDPATGEIWIANTGDPIHRLSPEGEVFARYEHNLRPYGLAWHPNDPDNYPLYILSADGESNLAISKMNVENGDIILLTQLQLAEGDWAGGCELSLIWDTSRWTLVTAIQNASGDRIELFDAGPNLAWLTAEPSSGSVAPDDDTECNLVVSSRVLDGGGYEADMIISCNAGVGEVRIPILLTVEPELAGIPDDLPTGYNLSAIFPNPSNGVSTIRFNLPRTGQANLSIWNAAGRLVETVYSGELPAGQYQQTFLAENLPSGVYFVRLESTDGILTRKLALLK